MATLLGRIRLQLATSLARRYRRTTVSWLHTVRVFLNIAASQTVSRWALSTWNIPSLPGQFASSDGLCSLPTTAHSWSLINHEVARHVDSPLGSATCAPPPMVRHNMVDDVGGCSYWCG